MESVFEEISKEEHELRMHSSHFLSLANNISTTLSGSLRKILKETITQSENDTRGSKIPATEYLEKHSRNYHAKVGYISGNSDFISFGLTTEFIQKCCHKWISGGGSPVIRKELSMVEEAFLPTLTELCVENLSQALDKLIPSGAEVSIIDDKELALAKDKNILCYDLNFSFGEYNGTLHLMATADFVASLREEQQAKANNQFKQYLNSNITKKLTVEFGEINLTTQQVKNLKKGDVLYIEHDNFCSIHAEGASETFGYGELGVNQDTNQRVVKII